MNAIRNHVQIVGNLGRDPEVQTTTTGKKRVKITVACSDSYTSKDGKRVENTEWFNISLWDGLATIAEKFLTKGSQVAISGRLSNRNWTDKEGKKHFATDIVVADLLMLGGAKKAA
ncbi:MAG TPA: single-stranded DNA-binding protein [Bacteroidia bacterium]|nr:single-stranded DNA-binding protein [Bacteroidia bacterium]